MVKEMKDLEGSGEFGLCALPGRGPLRYGNARLAASRPGVSLFPLRRLFQVSGERENLSPLFRGYPLHLRLKARRNVELNHLRHIHPPIHGSSPIVLGITMPGVLLSYLFRCWRGAEESGGARENGTQLFLARGVSSAANHAGTDVLICPVERSSTFLTGNRKPAELCSAGQMRTSAPTWFGMKISRRVDRVLVSARSDCRGRSRQLIRSGKIRSPTRSSAQP